jgi:flagellar biosynthesis chaperone FliJ
MTSEKEFEEWINFYNKSGKKLLRIHMSKAWQASRQQAIEDVITSLQNIIDYYSELDKEKKENVCAGICIAIDQIRQKFLTGKEKL